MKIVIAKTVMHEVYGRGTVVPTMHSGPNEDGYISEYDVMFEHDIVQDVQADELEILDSDVVEIDDEEFLDELSRKTLSSYTRKAADDATYHSYEVGDKTRASDPSSIDHDKRWLKRMKGITASTERLAKEEVELAERNKENKLKKDIHVTKKGDAELTKIWGKNFKRGMTGDHRHDDHDEDGYDYNGAVHTRRKTWVKLAKRVGRGKSVGSFEEQALHEELSDAAHELVLHADNSSKLHTQSHQPIIKNLKHKMGKGVYDSEKAKVLWGHHADRAAHDYAHVHGDGTPWHKMFSKDDRKQAAAHWEHTHRDELHEEVEGLEEKNWIAGAIKHPGALHRKLHVPEGEKIPTSKINAAAKKGGTLGKEANLAKTLSKMHKEENELEEKSSKGMASYLEYQKRYGPGGKKKPKPEVKEENISEGMRLIATHTAGPHKAKVYRDSDWDEHRIRYYTNDKYHGEDADSFESSPEDAHATAKATLAHYAKHHKEEVEYELEEGRGAPPCQKNAKGVVLRDKEGKKLKLTDPKHPEAVNHPSDKKKEESGHEAGHEGGGEHEELDSEHKTPIVHIRAAARRHGGDHVQFDNGETHHISKEHAHKVATAHAAIEKPADKKKYQDWVGHSHANFKKAANGEHPSEDKPKAKGNPKFKKMATKILSARKKAADVEKSKQNRFPKDKSPSPEGFWKKTVKEDFDADLKRKDSNENTRIETLGKESTGSGDTKTVADQTNTTHNPVVHGSKDTGEKYANKTAFASAMRDPDVEHAVLEIMKQKNDIIKKRAQEEFDKGKWDGK